jgi:hypothetical protein
VHRAELVDGRLKVIGSRLLDVGIAAGAAATDASAGRVRLVAGVDGAIEFHELSLQGPAEEPLAASSPLLERDWTTALGLRIDAAGEVVAISR